MKKEDIEIISTYDLGRIDLLVHYRINAPDKKTVISEGYTSIDYDSWLYFNDDQYEQDNYLKNIIMNDVELHKPDMNQMSDILKLCVSNLQGSGFSIYYDDMIKNDITLIDVCDLYNDIKTYQINISDLLINDEMIDIFYDNDFDTPVIFGGIGLLEYFDFKNYKEMDASIEEYVDMVFDYD